MNSNVLFLDMKLFTLFFICIWQTLNCIPVEGSTNFRGRVVVDMGGHQNTLYEKSYALLIGVSQYQHGSVLDTIPTELDEIEAMLERHGFKVVRISDPDDHALENAFSDFINHYGRISSQNQNRLLFYFAGHGHTFSGDMEGYLVPANAPLPHKDRAGFVATAYSMYDIMALARKIKAKHALFLFDSCFSGTIFEARSDPSPSSSITKKALNPVRQFITAGSANEVVPASSAFDKAFVMALDDGDADFNHDGYVTGSELGVYIMEFVPFMSNTTPQYGKIQDIALWRGDFVFELETRMHGFSPKLPVTSNRGSSDVVNLLGAEELKTDTTQPIRLASGGLISLLDAEELTIPPPSLNKINRHSPSNPLPKTEQTHLEVTPLKASDFHTEAKKVYKHLLSSSSLSKPVPIDIKAPNIAENGAVVPVQVSSSIYSNKLWGLTIGLMPHLINVPDDLLSTVSSQCTIAA